MGLNFLLPYLHFCPLVFIEFIIYFQMRPLAAFRPYLEDVHSIVVLDGSAALLELARSRRETSGASVGGLSGGRSLGGVSTSSAGGELLETVSWVKDRVSETVNRFRLSSSDYPQSSSSYIVTIGNGYRYCFFLLRWGMYGGVSLRNGGKEEAAEVTLRRITIAEYT